MLWKQVLFEVAVVLILDAEEIEAINAKIIVKDIGRDMNILEMFQEVPEPNEIVKHFLMKNQWNLRDSDWLGLINILDDFYWSLWIECFW